MIIGIWGRLFGCRFKHSLGTQSWHLMHLYGNHQDNKIWLCLKEMMAVCSLCFYIALCQHWCLEVNNVSFHWSHLAINFSTREGSFSKFPSSFLSFKIKIFFLVWAHCIRQATGIFLPIQNTKYLCIKISADLLVSGSVFF